MKNDTKNCLVCKKVFKRPYQCGYDFWRQRKYCSVKCYGIKKRTSREEDCLVCHKKFYISPSKRTGGNGKYCSMKCSGIAQQKREVTTCKMCGEKIIDQGSKKRQYCSVSCAGKVEMKKLWHDKKFKEKRLQNILKGMWNRPTSLEKQMIGIIQKHNLPYKYVGDGGFLIGFKNPDFVNINGEKKLIEVGNVYHHQDNYIEKRREHFAKYGWKSFIFIQDKLDEELILNSLGGGVNNHE